MKRQNKPYKSKLKKFKNCFAVLLSAVFLCFSFTACDTAESTVPPVGEQPPDTTSPTDTNPPENPTEPTEPNTNPPENPENPTEPNAKLATPANLRLSVTSRELNLSWYKVPNAVGYKVSINDKYYDSEYSPLNAKSYTDLNGVNVFRVLAYASDSKYDSEWSEPLTYDCSDSLFNYQSVENNTAYSIAAKDKTSLSGVVTVPDSHGGKPVTQIAQNGFLKCENITEIILPDSITQLNSCSFDTCSNLTKIKLSTRLKIVGSFAFSDCTSLKEIEFGNELTSIGLATFRNCNNLETLAVPENVEQIGERAFQNCSALKSITLPEGVKEIGARAFKGCSAFKSITLPASLSSIDGSIFPECSALSSVEVDKNNPVFFSEGNCIIRKADNVLIAGCPSSTIPAYIKVIGEKAFYECTLENPVLPEGLEVIEDSAFDWASFAHIYFPSTLKKLGRSAFARNEKLKSVILPSTVQDVGSRVFNAEFATVYVENGTLSAWEKLFGYCGFVVGCSFLEENGKPYLHSFVFQKDGDKFKTVSFLNPIQPPYREGYTFLGWTSQEGGEVELKPFIYTYADRAPVELAFEYTVVNKIPYESGTTLYAVWGKNV